jgi:biotin carboxylase
MSKKILVIGAAESCLGMIQTIKKMGHLPIVIGKSDTMPAKTISDYYFISEDNDVESVVNYCNEIGVDAIVPVPVDWPLLWMSKVAERLGLIFIPIEKIDNYRHKFFMKQCLIENNINCAKGILIKVDEINKDILSEFHFPLIVKPIDQYASRGVTKPTNINELIHYAKEASEFSANGDVVIEEFIDGREFNAEGVCFNGQVEIYAIVEKISDPFPRTIEMGHIIPPDITNIEEKTIVDTVSKAVLALGMKNGAFNAEIKLVHGEGYIIEVNGRLAGDFIISHLVKPTTGQDMEQEVVKMSLGLQIEKAHRKYIKHGIISYFNLPAGKKIRQINDFSYLSRDPNIIETHLYYKEGEVIPEVLHMGHRSGFVIVTSETRQGMFEIAEKTKMEIINSIILE